MQFGRGGKPSAGAFFDSDFSTIDTFLAQALIHGLQGKNDCRVAIVTMSRPNLAVAGFADSVERYYRGPAAVFAQVPPMGMRTAGAPGETPAAITAPFRKTGPDGAPLHVNKVKTVIDTGDPNTLFRNYLEAQNDDNAFFVLAGPATNLASSLDFRGMKELIVAKTKYLVAANFTGDPAAAKKVFAEWPTPIVSVGPEIGTAFLFPGASIDREFAANAPDHPVAELYRAWKAMPYDCPSGAMAAALHAARPKEGYFKVSEPGTITVRDDGSNTFAASANGKHQHLIADPDQKEKILKAYVELASAKPVMPQRFRPNADKAADKAADMPLLDKPAPPKP
jgi:purine nucleosidase